MMSKPPRSYADKVSAVAMHGMRRALLERVARYRGHESLTAVARAADVAHQYVDRWLSSQGGQAGKAEKVAAVLGLTLTEMNLIRTGELREATEFVESVERGERIEVTDMRLPVSNGIALPVRFAVQAGAWLEVDDMAQARIKSPPVSTDERFPARAQWLELVRGDSVDLFYPEGSFVHVVDAIEIGYAPRDEDFVVVERKRQQGGLIERSLKQVAKKGRKYELWPRSRNPKWNAPLNVADGNDDDTTIEIAALVLGGYLPARRS